MNHDDNAVRWIRPAREVGTAAAQPSRSTVGGMDRLLRRQVTAASVRTALPALVFHTPTSTSLHEVFEDADDVASHACLIN